MCVATAACACQQSGLVAADTGVLCRRACLGVKEQPLLLDAQLLALEQCTVRPGLRAHLRSAQGNLCAGWAVGAGAWLTGKQLRTWNCIFFSVACYRGFWFLGAFGHWIPLPLGGVSKLLAAAWPDMPFMASLPHAYAHHCLCYAVPAASACVQLDIMHAAPDA